MGILSTGGLKMLEAILSFDRIQHLHSSGGLEDAEDTCIEDSGCREYQGSNLSVVCP